MTAPSIDLIGDDTINRLFTSNSKLDSAYYRYLFGAGENDILYGGYGIVKLTGGTGADRFIIGATPGGNGSSESTTISDYNLAEGDRIALSGGLTTANVTVRAVTQADLARLNNLDDPDRIPAAIGDAVIFSDQTGQAIAVIKNTSFSDIQFVGIETLGLTEEETSQLAPPTNGLVSAQNFAPPAPAFGVRIVEYADLDSRPAYYLSSGLYTTLAGAPETLNKFVSFDFSDPPAPYGTYLNGRVGPLQHTHANELELFFVVAGTYIFTEGMQDGNTGVLEDHILTPGMLGYGPQGRVHGFRADPGDGPGKIFSLALPAGLDAFFQNSGTAVTNRFDQIKPNSQPEANNTSFWAGQRGDEIFMTDWDLGQINGPAPGAWSELRPPYTGTSIDGRPIPTFQPPWPDMVTSSIYSDTRPTSLGEFGESRLTLVTADEAKAVTGRLAWKGPFSLPSEPGGSFVYDYITLEPGLNETFELSSTVEEAPHDPLDPTPSSFTVLYSLDGPLSIRLYDQFDPISQTLIDNTFNLDPLTYVQLPTGTRYSLANNGLTEAQALSINLFNQVAPVVPTPGSFVAAPGADNSLVKIFDASGALKKQFTAFKGFNGSLSVAYGDLNNDGVNDIVAAAGPGGGPHVKVFDGLSGNEIASFYAYVSNFGGGVSVAVGDLNGDGMLELITGAGAGGGPHVKAFAMNFNGGVAAPQEVASFFAYDPSFRGGVSVAAGDVNGDGAFDIITGAGAGGGPHVRAFGFGAPAPALGELRELASFNAYDANFRGGVSVASGNIDGLGPDEIITGPGAGGGPHVKAFSRATDGTVSTVSSFFAYDPSFRSGVEVGTMASTSPGVSAVLTGAGPGGGPHVRGFDLSNPLGQPSEVLSLFAEASTFRGGVAVS